MSYPFTTFQQLQGLGLCSLIHLGEQIKRTVSNSLSISPDDYKDKNFRNTAVRFFRKVDFNSERDAHNFKLYICSSWEHTYSIIHSYSPSDSNRCYKPWKDPKHSEHTCRLLLEAMLSKEVWQLGQSEDGTRIYLFVR